MSMRKNSARAIAPGGGSDSRPGPPISPSKAEFVAPDAYAFKRTGRWHVSLSQNCQPKLSINAQYTYADGAE